MPFVISPGCGFVNAFLCPAIRAQVRSAGSSDVVVVVPLPNHLGDYNAWVEYLSDAEDVKVCNTRFTFKTKVENGAETFFAEPRAHAGIPSACPSLGLDADEVAKSDFPQMNEQIQKILDHEGLSKHVEFRQLP